jgi:hypothetical protein
MSKIRKMIKLLFPSIIAILFVSGFKSNSKNYRIVYFDTVPAKNIDTFIKKAPDTLRDPHIIFTKAEVPPFIDQTVWRKHLQGYLKTYIENAAKQNMRVGTYTVQIKFLIETDGSIKNVQALNDVGYGLTQAAIKVVEESPKWTPARQNGTVVRCLHTQPITFVIQDK